MGFNNDEILYYLELAQNSNNLNNDDQVDLNTVIENFKNGEPFNSDLFRESMERIFKNNTIFNDDSIRDDFLNALYNSNREIKLEEENRSEETTEESQNEENLEAVEEKTEELDENNKALINEIENVQEILYTDPEDVENYSEEEQKINQILEEIKERIINNKVEEQDKTVLKNIFNKYIPESELSKKEVKNRIEHCTDLVDNLKVNEEIVETKKEIEIISEIIRENEVYESKFLEENREAIIDEFISTTKKELEELEGRELTEEEQNKENYLNRTIEELSRESISNENIKSLLKARKYNENNELYLRVIDNQIEELKNQLDEQQNSNDLDNTTEELSPEERLEIKVTDENREEIIKALNEVLDEKEKTATEEEKQSIQNQKNNINNPTYKNENIESLINNNDLTQEVLESRINSIDKEIEEIVTPNPIIEHIALLNSQLQDVERQIKEKNQEIEQALESSNQEKARELLAERDNIYESQKKIKKQLEGQKSKIPGFERKITTIDEHIALLNGQLQDVERQIKEKNQEIEQALESNNQEKARELLAERDSIYESKKMIEKQLGSQKVKQEEQKNEKVNELQKKKEKLIEDLNKVKTQKEKTNNKVTSQENDDDKKDTEEKKSNTDIENKIAELKEKRDRIALNSELRKIKDAYNTIKKDAINILSNSESFKNAKDDEKLAAISNEVETHERFKDLNLYKGNRKKLIEELKEDIAKGLGLKIEKEKNNEENKEKSTEEKWYLKALSGAAGFGLGWGTAMITSGIPATIAVGMGIAAVKVYSNKIAPNVTAKIEKIQSAENYAKEHPIKNKLLNGVKKVNKFLTSGYGRWFVNGYGAGYLTGKIYKQFHPKKTTTQTHNPTRTTEPKPKPTDTTPDTTKPTPDSTKPTIESTTKLEKGMELRIDKDLGGAIDEEGHNFGSLSDEHTQVVVDKIKDKWVHVKDAVKVGGKKEGVGWIKKEELLETIKEGTTKIGRHR